MSRLSSGGEPKVLLFGEAPDQARFKREAELRTELSHPGIVRYVAPDLAMSSGSALRSSAKPELGGPLAFSSARRAHRRATQRRWPSRASAPTAPDPSGPGCA